MTEIINKNKDIEKIEKYPKEIEAYGEIGLMIWDTLKDNEMTRAMLKNKIYENLFKQISKGKDLYEVIEELQNKGVIKKKAKQTEIVVYGTKEDVGAS